MPLSLSSLMSCWPSRHRTACLFLHASGVSSLGTTVRPAVLHGRPWQAVSLASNRWSYFLPASAPHCHPCQPLLLQVSACLHASQLPPQLGCEFQGRVCLLSHQQRRRHSHVPSAPAPATNTLPPGAWCRLLEFACAADQALRLAAGPDSSSILQASKLFCCLRSPCGAAHRHEPPHVL